MKLNFVQALVTLITHPTFWVTGCAWLTACLTKVVLLRLRSGQFQWHRFFGTGGMPSSHTAFFSGLTVSIGMSEGFNSAVLGLSLGVTIITAVDATGLRRSAGRQAEMLNKIVAELYEGKATRPPKLKEALGHTPLQVVVGALIGAAVSFFLYPVHP